jgi:predicted AlkP superfamily phosphohydrolase/phosphomutase
MVESRRRVVVIGLDGASYDLVRRWTDTNQLPALAAMRRNGTWGRLDSILPYQSVAAWTSFITGKTPAKHGHFDFVTRMCGTRTVLHVNNANTIDGETLWRYLNRGGKRIGILNVPVTYPVRPVNGFMIPDWLTPSRAKSPTYPPELADQLREQFGDYLFEFRSGPYELGRQSETNFLRGLYHATRQRAASALHLLATRTWDFFMVVFTGPDTLQHFLWHRSDPTHPLYDASTAARNGDALLQYYELLDQIIGEFSSRLPSDTSLVVISDHGFGPLVKLFNANKLLMDLGLLAVAQQPLKHRSGLLHGLELLDAFNMRRFLPRSVRTGALNWIMKPPVDWQRTQAYSGTSTEDGIYINLRGRGPDGIVDRGEYALLLDRIRCALLAVHDPDTGRRVVDRVHRKADLYHGPHLDNMPDLLLVMAEGYELVESFDVEHLFLRPTLRRTGTHRPEGIFFAKGPDIIAGREISPASLVDVPPTLLYLMELPVPSDMDGRVLDVFEAGQERPPVRYVTDTEPPAEQTHRQDRDAEEEEEVKERLRALGYLE